MLHAEEVSVVSTHTTTEKDEWRAKMTALAKRIRAMDGAQREALAARMPIVTCEGHALSSFNTCFLTAQAAGAPITMVAGYRQWKKAARYVQKDEHAIGYIYVPSERKRQDAQGQGGEIDPETMPEGEQESAGVRFLLVPVFDVSQTAEIA
jgi:hypothetical protein